MLFVLLFMNLFTAVQLQDLDEECSGGSCNPQIGDLMVGRAAQLAASSTCGVNGPQDYCIIGYLEEEQKCFTCDSRRPYSLQSNPNSHRIDNVITTFEPERKMKWWQSENGVHEVSIRLDLETVFQFSHLVLTFKSFRPAAMLVERSQDFGQTWKVFRYFAEDCSLYFPNVPRQIPDSIDDVVCDSRYSGSEPSTEGEVVLKALDPVFKIENPYAPHIQELITVTNLRMNFTHLFTLGDTLLGRKRKRNPQNKYFYALYEMVVRGSCFCNGHAAHCSPVGGRGDAFEQPGMVHGQCVCQHNTAGYNCERCQDFHHDSPWRPGGENNAEVCRRCNCNGHSDSCHFDPARFDATGGLSGGVCENCRDDRVGPQCERCRPFTFRDPQRAPNDSYSCIPCECDSSGSDSRGLCDEVSGQCRCKENVEGRRCDRCKPGFFGLRADDPVGCQPCRCHPLGSVGSCDVQTGSCQCERLAVGPSCDQCVPGYFGLASGLRCAPCDCDIGGAHSSTCAPGNGQCQCLPNMDGRRCSDPSPGHFLPQLDYFLYEAELAAPLELIHYPPPTSPPPPPPSSSSSSSSSLQNPIILPKCEQYYREQGYDFKISNGQVVVVRRTRRNVRRRRQQYGSIPLDPGHALQIIPRERTPGGPVTWTGLGVVRVLNGAGLRFTVDNLPLSMDYQLAIRFEPESPSDWLASVSITPLSPGDQTCESEPIRSGTMTLAGNSRAAVLGSRVCLNTGARYFVDITFNKRPESDPASSSHVLIDSMGLIPSIESVQDLCSQSELDSFRRFRCVGLAAEAGPQEELPDVCDGLVKSMSARIHKGAIACGCNAVGSLGPYCSKLGGICDCKPNVIGRCCDSCAPQTYRFGPEGCKPCDCDPRGAVSELCDQVRGQCACRMEVAGRRCDRCQPGYWGFPLCRPCECNSLSEICAEETGECLDCREHSTGPQCESCLQGYYGSPVSRIPCQPCLCPDLWGSGRFFASSCLQDPETLGLTCNCREGHTGPLCDRCSPGFHGDLLEPGARCEECVCSNNIDPDDSEACDGLTGECLRCLHNTVGRHCQDCKPGYHGNALVHDCKECSCDRRGTEVTQCPLQSPCFCDPQTGQCPCRAGVTGVLCDECEDGYWNLDRASGCQPCTCANSVSNVCDKVTGQCPCRPEYGGKQCDECGENHFGNPDLQCVSCDCNLEGTLRPSCDPETGECNCREGVTGILCDECAPGYDSEFPACIECHPCASVWAHHVTDVERAAQTMKTFIPRPTNELRPGALRQQQLLQSLYLDLGDLRKNVTLPTTPNVNEMEKLFQKIVKLKNTIDPNLIQLDPTLLLNIEIDNIKLQFKKLLDNLHRIADSPDDEDDGDVAELLDEIKKSFKSFTSEEKRLKNANQAVEDSADTRQDAKQKLSACSGEGVLGPLEKKVKALSVVDFNKQICGGPGVGCSGCGGALCRTWFVGRRCGGPDCDGIVSLSNKATKTAKKTKDALISLPSQLLQSKNKMDKANRTAQETKDQAKDLQDRINTSKESLEKDKDKTKELIKRVKEYLLDELLPAEDIERMARAVLSIQLPRTPEQVRATIEEINNLLSSTTDFQRDLKDLEEQAKTAQDLQQEAQYLENRTKAINVRDITQDLYDAAKAQNKANEVLYPISQAQDMIKDRLREINDDLDEVETKLDERPVDLQEEIEALKKKSEQNREQAKEAKEAAESVFQSGSDISSDLFNVLIQFDLLKEKESNKTEGNEAAKRLKELMKEADEMKRQMEDKLQQIEGLEKWIENLNKNREDKAAKVAELLKKAESLKKDISRKAEDYVKCS